jgi:cystathionine gamma-synthase/methionine-gamma-lyase
MVSLETKFEEQPMAKPDKSYRKRKIGNHDLKPESLVMGYGFDPAMSEGSIKPPIFMTSTFAFKSARDGEVLFRQLAGKREEGDPEEADLIYTRFNNPNMEVLEDRLTLYDAGEDALVFSSGMGAITTALLACAGAGTTILHSSPLYGGTEVFMRTFMPDFGVTPFEMDAWATEELILAQARKAAAKGPLSVIFTESPANPTCALVDIRACARVAETIETETGHRPIIMCDNTMMGPIGHAPLKHGADLALYSLTKYIGGHSDLVAGAAIGTEAAISKIRRVRNYLGTTLDAHTCWLVTRSLETVQLRMEKAFANARLCAEFLRDHSKIGKVMYPAFFEEGDPQKTVYDEQCQAAGSTFSFDVKGGKEAAFRLLDSLQLVKLAVSLGGTESLMCHPGSTTHSGVSEDIRKRIGFTDGLVRFSVGIEAAEDLIADLTQALEKV